MRLSQRSAFPQALNRWTDASRRARDAVDLTASNPTAVGLMADPSLLSELASPGVLFHEPAPFGLPAARRAVAAHVGAPAERVVLTASTSEAYDWLFKLVCDPGDAIAVPQPSYPLFDHLLRLGGLRPSPYRLFYDGEWSVDLPSLRAAVTESAAVIAVQPNNPTGSFLSQAELEALATSERPVILDEVFRAYPLEGPLGPSQPPELPFCFRLGGLSKELGLPQLKLGWIVVEGRDPLVEEALARLELIADTSLSLGAPVQHAVPTLLREGGRLRETIHKRVRGNLEALKIAAAGSALTVRRVAGGWYAVVEAPQVDTDEVWCLRLMEEHNVRVQPGYFYDTEEDALLVLSLLPQPSAFLEGLDRLLRGVASLAG